MALKVKAVERLLKFDKEKEGKYRYVLSPDLYSSLDQDKVIKEAASRSGVMEGVMQACWWRGNQGLGHRRTLGCHSRTGHHAFRTAW